MKVLAQHSVTQPKAYGGPPFPGGLKPLAQIEKRIDGTFQATIPLPNSFQPQDGIRVVGVGIAHDEDTAKQQACLHILAKLLLQRPRQVVLLDKDWREGIADIQEQIVARIGVEAPQPERGPMSGQPLAVRVSEFLENPPPGDAEPLRRELVTKIIWSQKKQRANPSKLRGGPGKGRHWHSELNKLFAPGALKQWIEQSTEFKVVPLTGKTWAFTFLETHGQASSSKSNTDAGPAIGGTNSGAQGYGGLASSSSSHAPAPGQPANHAWLRQSEFLVDMGAPEEQAYHWASASGDAETTRLAGCPSLAQGGPELAPTMPASSSCLVVDCMTWSQATVTPPMPPRLANDDGCNGNTASNEFDLRGDVYTGCNTASDESVDSCLTGSRAESPTPPECGIYTGCNSGTASNDSDTVICNASSATCHPPSSWHSKQVLTPGPRRGMKASCHSAQTSHASCMAWDLRAQAHPPIPRPSWQKWAQAWPQPCRPLPQSGENIWMTGILLPAADVMRDMPSKRRTAKQQLCSFINFKARFAGLMNPQRLAGPIQSPALGGFPSKPGRHEAACACCQTVSTDL